MVPISVLNAHRSELALIGVAIAVLTTIADSRLLFPALLLAAFAVIAQRMDRSARSRRTPADPAILLLGLSAGLSLLVSVDRDITAPLVFKLALGMALFYAVVNGVQTRLGIRWMQAGIILTGAGLALLAPFIVDWVTFKIPLIPDSVYDRFSRLATDTVHRNVMAGYLLVIVSMLLGWTWIGWREYDPRRRAAFGSTAGLLLVMLILTQSRGALLGLLLSMITLLSLRFRRGWLLIPVGILALGILVGFLGLDNLSAVISPGISLGGWEDRVGIWSRALRILRDFPLTGVGMGLFGQTAEVLYHDYYSEGRVLSHAHNLFLQVGVDLGIPGLIAWLSINMLVLLQSWQIFRQGLSADSAETAGLGAGFICGQIALLGHGLLDAVTWGDVRPAPILWGIWGLVFAARQVLLPQPINETDSP